MKCRSNRRRLEATNYQQILFAPYMYLQFSHHRTSSESITQFIHVFTIDDFIVFITRLIIAKEVLDQLL